MQIGQFMRNMVGEPGAAVSKTLDLKIGQVVKGMVLQLLSDQDALLNIGGVHVRAKLETPLQQGQVTLLQVQPESKGGQLIMKPVKGNASETIAQSLSELVKSFGAKEQASIRLLAGHMQRLDVPLSKKNVDRFREIMTLKPAGVTTEQWLEAAAVAYKRNLPLTKETVQGLREALFGPPLGDGLDSLEAKAGEALRSVLVQDGGGSEELKAMLDKLQQAIGRVREATNPMQSSFAQGEEAAPPHAAESSRINNDANIRPHAVERETADIRAQIKPADNWISKLFKAVGMNNEHEAARTIEKAEARALQSVGSGSGLAVHSESLKNVLLHIASSEATPEPLRELAQQTVHQITGQQLLLSPDREAVLTNVTFMLPMRNGNGEQSGAVHIQSRKGQRGEIDANNCRLLFDLRMEALGDTLVDVQVLDRNVILQVHNDFPHVGLLLEQFRDEIEEGLSRNGYQFMALRHSAFPRPADAEAANEESVEGDQPGQIRQAAEAFHIKPYKGVDVRV